MPNFNPYEKPSEPNVLSKLTASEVQLLIQVLDSGRFTSLRYVPEVNNLGIRTSDQVETAITNIRTKLIDNLTLRESI